jgi:hypothetical protein
VTYIYIWIVIGIIYGDGDYMGIIWIIWITWNIFIIWILSGYYMDMDKNMLDMICLKWIII